MDGPGGIEETVVIRLRLPGEHGNRVHISARQRDRGAVGFDRPNGLCIDTAGNVYVPDAGTYQIFVYKHGGKSPVATLADLGYQPVSCAYDPKSGNLAVANILYFREGIEGNVAVYHGAGGTPTLYSVDTFYSYYFLSYDDKGNLFVDGLNSQPGAMNPQFEYAELPHGKSTMEPLVLSGASISFPGNVQWDVAHITVGDQDNAVIYQTEGTKIVGTTPLSGTTNVVQFYIDGATVIAPDAASKTSISSITRRAARR